MVRSRLATNAANELIEVMIVAPITRTGSSVSPLSANWVQSAAVQLKYQPLAHGSIVILILNGSAHSSFSFNCANTLHFSHYGTQDKVLFITGHMQCERVSDCVCASRKVAKAIEALGVPSLATTCCCLYY